MFLCEYMCWRLKDEHRIGDDEEYQYVKKTGNVFLKFVKLNRKIAGEVCEFIRTMLMIAT